MKDKQSRRDRHVYKGKDKFSKSRRRKNSDSIKRVGENYYKTINIDGKTYNAKLTKGFDESGANKLELSSDQGLSVNSEGGNQINLQMDFASEQNMGGTQLATQAETTEGTLRNRAVTPYGLSAYNGATYSISCVDGDNSDEEKIRLTAGGSTSGTDDVVLEAGTGLSIARDGDKITFTNTVTDTDTVLTAEQVQDIVGAMFTSNTETRISATYEDGDGTIDLVVDDFQPKPSEGAFANGDKTKLDGIASGATANTGDVTLSGDQTITGRKIFNKAFPQVKYTDDSATDTVEIGLSGNTFYHKTSDTDINFGWRDNSNNDLLSIDTSDQTVTIGEGPQTTYKLKIGDNGRMNMPLKGLEFENAHGYFAETGNMFLPLFINVTQTDLIRFQTPLTFEYWDYSSSAWVDDISNVNNLKNMLDGRRSTTYSVSNTKRKFRFVIERQSTWADDHLFYIENTWSSILSGVTWNTAAAGGNPLTPTMQVERLDGSFDASDDTNNDWTTNSGITTDWHTTGIVTGFGLMMYYSTSMHNAEKHIRITVTIPEYADTSKTFAIKNIGALSSYSSQNTNQQPFLQDFDRNATGYGHLNIPSGHDYKINASSVLNATTLGSGVVNSSLTSVGTLGSLSVTGNATVGGVVIGGHTLSDVDIGSEFNDVDDHLMSSGAIKEKIESYGYTTDTQLTTEQVQDIVGAMVSGNTETNIAVSYDDTAGKLDFASTDTNTTYSEATSSSAGLMSTAHHDKLDGIENNATADQTKSDINGLAITTVGTIDDGTWEGTSIESDYIGQLPASKIASGTFADARISESSVTQHTPSIHWTRSTGGYFTANNTSMYTQSWEGDETWGNTVSITTTMGGESSVGYSDVYGGIWIAPVASKVTKSSIVVRNLSYADDLTIKLWKINPADLRIYAINSVDITVPNTSSIVVSNTDLTSGNSIEENYVLLATINKQATSGTSRHYFTWTISGTYD